MRTAFTGRELDIMTVLWDAGPSTAAEVRDALEARGITLAYNTVLTILRILEDKGRVSRRSEGRAHRYRALVGREAAGASAVARLVDTVFGGSAERLLTHLVRDPSLDAADIRRLRRLLDERLREEGER
jgi:predicted transcriptional regulator